MMEVSSPTVRFGDIDFPVSGTPEVLPWRSFENGTFPKRARPSLVAPVIPVERRGKLELVAVRPGELAKPSASDETADGRNERPRSSSPSAFGWGSHQADQVNRQSLYSVLVTHDFRQRQEVRPRGLQNPSNMCFFNAVLQALIHTESMYALLHNIQTKAKFQIKTKTPILDGLVSFIGFYGLQRSSTLSAERFYQVICSHPNFRHLEPGRQEDAQEFLGYLLDTLEENFDAAEPAPGDEELIKDGLREQSPPAEEESTEEWTHIGKNNKKIESREAGRTDHTNPILIMFGGRLRSVLKKPNESDSITLESFQQICVDISSDKVSSVQDAIDHMLEKEELQIESRKKTVIASKQLEFDRVPPVLIVTIKRFTFTYNDSSLVFGKISKPIAINNLTINCGEKVRYKPVAVVYHHGPSATVGHYTADVLVGDTWFNTDDEYVQELTDPPQESKAVYIVFYERI